MNDYHQRFRERYPKLLVELQSVLATSTEGHANVNEDILAFIDEVMADSFNEASWNIGYERGKQDIRASIIKKVEGMNCGYMERRIDTSSHDDSFEDGAELMKGKILHYLRGEDNQLPEEQ